MSTQFDETNQVHLWTFRITGAVASGLGALLMRRWLS